MYRQHDRAYICFSRYHRGPMVGTPQTARYHGIEGFKGMSSFWHPFMATVTRPQTAGVNFFSVADNLMVLKRTAPTVMLISFFYVLSILRLVYLSPIWHSYKRQIKKGLTANPIYLTAWINIFELSIWKLAIRHVLTHGHWAFQHFGLAVNMCWISWEEYCTIFTLISNTLDQNIIHMTDIKVKDSNNTSTKCSNNLTYKFQCIFKIVDGQPGIMYTLSL